MKNQFKMILASAFLSLALLVSCQTSDEEIEAARQNVEDSKQSTVEAKQELNQAIIDSTKDFENFKMLSEERILLYEQKINEIKTQIALEKKGNRTKYQKLLTDLENKNAELKQNLKDYKATGRDNWEMFKVNVNNSLDSLGNSISDFFSSK